MKWIKENKHAVTLLAVAVLLLIGLAWMQGCALSDFIKVDIPPAVSNATGIDKRASITEAEVALDEYVRAGEKLAKSIEGGYEKLGVLQSFINLGIQVGGTSFPGGGLALAALFGTGGLLIKSPGTSKANKASYDKGVEAGKKIAEMV